MDSPNNLISQEQVLESIRQSLIEAGYAMAKSHAISMEEEPEEWGDNIINGKINPNCIDIESTASHAVYCHEIDSWLDLDTEIFAIDINFDIYELFYKFGVNDREIFRLIDAGANKFIEETYGVNWVSEYPNIDTK